MALPVTLFTDPACPFAFSAEPVRWRLRWHYGDQLAWTTRMIVLTREAGEADKLASGAPTLQRTHGMPIDPRPYPRPASSEPACQAVCAVRERHGGDAADRLLRALRVRVMQHGLLDDPDLIAAAAADAGVADWSGGEAAMEADAAAARSPSAHALDHKLGGPRDERRYTAPSYVFGEFVVAGFNPFEVYDTALANLGLERRRAPAKVSEVLEWAGTPLATAELVALSGRDEQSVRAKLAREASFTPAGADGYWSA